MSGHTPGPWMVDGQRSDLGRELWAGDVIVAEAVTDHNSREEAEANAHLIAAAPELLNALKSLLPALEGRGFSPTENEISAVIVAIAKAEGK